MIFSLVSQYIQASGMAGLLWVYLVLHLCVGWALPYRQGAKPYFFGWIENAGLHLERRLNRETRPQHARFIRGSVVALVVGVFAYLVGDVFRHIGKIPYGWIAELGFLSLCISFTVPLKLVQRIIRHLRKNELPQAIAALQPYLREPLASADAHAVIRKTIEFIAVSLNRFLVAPAFWFLLAGPVGTSLYMAYAALNQSFGQADGRRRSFGKAVRLIERLMNIVPALLTAFLLAVSALFVSKSNPFRALALPFQYRPAYAMLAAMAGGLGVTLGGVVRYSPDYTEDHPWIGSPESSARLVLEDLLRAEMLQYVFFICVVATQSILVTMLT